MSNFAEVREQVEPIVDRDFVRYLAHELRQPLSTIESIAYYLHIILPPDASNARQQVEKLQRLVEQSSWMVSNAVDFLQAGPFSPERIDLAELAARAIGLCDEPGPTLDCDGALPAITVDPAQGEHLLRNLFTFFWYAGSGGPITFRANAANAGEVLIESSSPAEGYSQERLDALLEPFGAGLPAGAGLSIASMRRIVEAHGGSMRARAKEDRISIEISLPA